MGFAGSHVFRFSLSLYFELYRHHRPISRERKITQNIKNIIFMKLARGCHFKSQNHDQSSDNFLR